MGGSFIHSFPSSTLFLPQLYHEVVFFILCILFHYFIEVITSVSLFFHLLQFFLDFCILMLLCLSSHGLWLAKVGEYSQLSSENELFMNTEYTVFYGVGDEQRKLKEKRKEELVCNLIFTFSCRILIFLTVKPLRISSLMRSISYSPILITWFKFGQYLAQVSYKILLMAIINNQ